MDTESENGVTAPARVATPVLDDLDHHVAMVAHELRDPLLPILNAAAVLLRFPPDAALVQRSAAIIDRQARHMSHLIDDLMNISRVKLGNLPMHRAPVSIAEIIGRCVETLEPFCAQRNQRLLVNVSHASMDLDADAIRLTQALRNVVANAAKFSDHGAELRIGAEIQGDCVIVKVSDSGIGIDPADLEPIFSPFVRGAQGAAAHTNGGLGVGLYLARSFVEAHGGTLIASSAGRGRGSTFTLRLPCLANLARDERSAAKLASAGQTPASPLRNTRRTGPRDEAGPAP
jgi:signal transduction histidine kinase